MKEEKRKKQRRPSLPRDIGKQEKGEWTETDKESSRPKYDAGYKQKLTDKQQFIHFLRKYVKADWAEELTEDQIEICDREFQLEDYQKRHALLPGRFVPYRG